MKKVLLIIAILAISGFVQAQENMDTINYSINASASFSNVSLSTPTGILFDNWYCLHGEFAGGLKYKNFGLNAAYNGYYSIGGKMVNLSDLSCSYSINNISFTVGYEFIYNQNVDEQSSTSHAIFGVASWKKGKLSMTGILFYNVQDNFIYAIASCDYRATDKINVHAVAGYTTAEPYPVYGLLGFQLLNNRSSIGFYGALRKGGGAMIELKTRLF